MDRYSHLGGLGETRGGGGASFSKSDNSSGSSHSSGLSPAPPHLLSTPILPASPQQPQQDPLDENYLTLDQPETSVVDHDAAVELARSILNLEEEEESSSSYSSISSDSPR